MTDATATAATRQLAPEVAELDTDKRKKVPTSGDVMDAIRARYPSPAWAIVAEVRNGTGWQGGAHRYADVIAFSLWPSRGLSVHGVEIKVSRSDWQRELADPEKAETFQRYCDAWWVAAPPGVVLKSELPTMWGLLELTPKGGLKVVKDAPSLTAEPLSRAFVAAVFRKAAESQEGVRAAAFAEGRDAGIGDDGSGRDNAMEALKMELERVKGQVASFEAEAGIRIGGGWHHDPAVGKAVKHVLSVLYRGDHVDALARMAEGMAMHAKRIQADAAALRRAVNALPGEPPQEGGS